ncbi:MAG: hypothetical protein IJ137_08060 [Eubacterium sp.]|nr:hypothetical protein [Eubacterium sp.]
MTLLYMLQSWHRKVALMVLKSIHWGYLLDVDAGTYDSFYYACPPVHMPKGFMELAAERYSVRSSQINNFISLISRMYKMIYH